MEGEGGRFDIYLYIFIYNVVKDIIERWRLKYSSLGIVFIVIIVINKGMKSSNRMIKIWRWG